MKLKINIDKITRENPGTLPFRLHCLVFALHTTIQVNKQHMYIPAELVRKKIKPCEENDPGNSALFLT